MPMIILKSGERREVVSFRLKQNTIRALNKLAEHGTKSMLIERLILEEVERAKKRK